jgi:putative membrane protein
MLRRVFRHTHVLALCAATAVAACSKGADGTADSTKSADAAAVGAATPATGTPAPAMPTLTDATILGKLHFDDVEDSTAGALAAAKGSDASVKEFGRLMVKDHHAMHLDVMELQKKVNLTPDTTMDAEAVAEKTAGDSMQAAARGAAWDKAFIAHAVDGHIRVLQFAQDAVNGTQNADIKALIQKHLDQARVIQGKLAATP